LFIGLFVGLSGGSLPWIARSIINTKNSDNDKDNANSNTHSRGHVNGNGNGNDNSNDNNEELDIEKVFFWCKVCWCTYLEKYLYGEVGGDKRKLKSIVHFSFG